LKDVQTETSQDSAKLVVTNKENLVSSSLALVLLIKPLKRPFGRGKNKQTFVKQNILHQLIINQAKADPSITQPMFFSSFIY
jgi:hypothetical protein